MTSHIIKNPANIKARNTAQPFNPEAINNDAAKPQFHGWLGVPGDEGKTGDELNLRNPVGVVSLPFRPEFILRDDNDEQTKQLIASFHSVFAEAVVMKEKGKVEV